MIKREEQNLITKYEAETLQDCIEEIKDLDKNEADFKLTYTAKSGKYDLVVRTTVAKED